MRVVGRYWQNCDFLLNEKKDVYDTIRVFPATQQLKKYEANKKKAQNYVVQVDLCCMKYY